MRRLLPLLLVLPFVAGCVNVVADRAAYLQSFVGKPEAELVRALGVPTRTYDRDGHRFLAFDETSSQPVPIVAPYYGYGPLGPYGSSVVQYTCETTAEIDLGNVANFTLRGQGCGYYPY